jgi:hypothetical protein
MAAQPKRREYIALTGYEDEINAALAVREGDSLRVRILKARDQLVQVAGVFCTMGRVLSNMTQMGGGGSGEALRICYKPGTGQLQTDHPLFCVAAAVAVLEAYRVPYSVKVGYYHHRGVLHPSEANLAAWVLTPPLPEEAADTAGAGAGAGERAAAAKTDEETKEKGGGDTSAAGSREAWLRTDLSIYGWGVRGPIVMGAEITLKGISKPGAEYYNALPASMHLPKGEELLDVATLQRGASDLAAWLRGSECPAMHADFLRQMVSTISGALQPRTRTVTGGGGGGAVFAALVQ